jgi:hypothetical protein
LNLINQSKVSIEQRSLHQKGSTFR